MPTSEPRFRVKLRVMLSERGKLTRTGESDDTVPDARMVYS